MSLRDFVRRNRWLCCAYYVVDDWRAGRRLARGDTSTRSGMRFGEAELHAALGYIEKLHADYLAYAGVERFGGRIAEIGPGDNFGLALRLLADGADHVHGIDRYTPLRRPDYEAKLYGALAADPKIGALFDGPPAHDGIRDFTLHAGVAAERFFRDTDFSFDVILSRAVLEHLFDPLDALTCMAASLGSGGRMIHRIDLRDHGMFAGQHPLTFLTIPDALYRRMTQNAGRPNRILANRYREWLASSGLDGRIKVTRLAGVREEIPALDWNDIPEAQRATALAQAREIRPRLATSFREASDEDLAVQGIVLTAQKP